MRQMLVLTVCMGFFASATTAKAVSGGAAGSVGNGMYGASLASNGEPPGGYGGGGEEPPGGYGGGGEEPPGGYGGGGEGGGGEGGGEEGGGGGGGSEDSVILTGAKQYTCETNSLAGETFESSTADQNVILAQTNSFVTVSNCVLNKTGDTSSEDNSNFFALNAVVAAKTASTVCIADSKLNSKAKGANCLFASGTGSKIYAYDCNIVSTNNSSRGLDATYGGTVIAAKMHIDTSGMHCAAFATDRGNGSISVTDATMVTAGNGSPLIYSTGAIEVNSVTGTAKGAQIAGIEGLSAIRIRNSELSGSGKRASEPVANGVIIYQSNSGDSSDGTATFEVSGSTLASSITNGAMFYVTHSEAVITVKDTRLDFDSDVNWLIKAAGNDGSNGWGTAGYNGAGVIFTAIDQTLKGNISVDGISSNDLYLVNSTYTGTIEKDETYTGNGGANVFIDSNSTWTVTSNCTLKCLTAATGAKILDADGNAVSIVDADGTVYVSGTANPKITVSTYTEGNFAATNITDFTISRTAFDAMYGTSGSGGSGSSTDTGGQTYYLKPHAPTNAVIRVYYGETRLLPDRDHKYWVDQYWTNGVGVTVEISYKANKDCFFADGSSGTNIVLKITENKTEIYPPAGFESAYIAQAQSGSTYYQTLKAAIDAAGDRARVVVYDSLTLEETLTITNSITLDLNGTNVITLGSSLTNAFRFTADATVSNGTINSSLAANVADSVLMRFTDCKATLRDLVVNGEGYETVIAHDSENGATDENKLTKISDTVTCDGVTLAGNGCLLSIDRANATLTNACAFAIGGTLASFGGHQAAIYCTSNGTVSIVGGTYDAPAVLLSEDFGVFFKSDDVLISAPDGYVWENGRLVEGLPVESVTPGVASEPYVDAASATNAAAKINANKLDSISVPTGVDESAEDAYLGMVAAMVTGDNRVVVGLTVAAEAEVQSAVDEAVTNDTVFAALTGTDASAKVTIATTTPGLYYWIDGGTEVNAVTNGGAAVLSTDGGSVELTKPTLDATANRAFFSIAAGVSAPVQSDAD